MVTRRLLSRVDFFLSNSDFTWQRFLESDPRWTEASHRTVALGLDKPAEGAPLPEPDVTPAALIVGRMDREEDYKGHRQVIAAWPLLLEHLPEAKLWVLALDYRIIQWGGLVQNDVKPVYANGKPQFSDAAQLHMGVEYLFPTNPLTGLPLTARAGVYTDPAGPVTDTGFSAKATLFTLG